MISGIDYAEIITASETITLSNILPETKIDFSPVFMKNADGEVVRTRDKAKVEIVAANENQYFSLKKIMQDWTSVTEIKVRGLAEHFYFKEATTITIKKKINPKSGGINRIIVKATYDGDPTSNIYFSETWET